MLKSIDSFIRRHWQPKEIPPPEVDPDLEDLDGVQRAGEVLRYSILSFEWWLSPKGTLREWLRLNTRGFAWLLIPAILILPIVGYYLGELYWWLLILIAIAGHLIVFSIVAAIIIGIITLVKGIIK
jgi:hypothetical protein